MLLKKKFAVLSLGWHLSRATEIGWKTDLFTVWGQTGADTFTVDIAADCDLQQLHQADPYLVRVGYSLDKANCREVIKEGTPIDGVTVTENPGKRYLRIK
jgi:hypothetical protein